MQRSQFLKKQNESWRDSVIRADTPIKVLIEQLNTVGIKIALVLDNSEHLLGTVSDGDFRRGMLRGLTLQDSVEKIMNTSPRTVKENSSRLDVLNLMEKTKILQIPIVDNKNKVIGLHLWDEISAKTKYSNVMVIMAGGKGSRLHPQTEKTPKPMLQVAGRPILEHIIRRAQSQGFNHFIIAINYLGKNIEDYFKSGESFGAKIEYLREESPLGTAGALSLIREKLEKAFIVTNGDVITDINYSNFLEFHSSQNAGATVAVHTHEFQIPYGVVQIDGLKIVSYEEKPIVSNLINAGVYALDPSILDLITETKFRNMPEILEMAKSQHKNVIVYPLHESWIDVGRPSDLELANENANRVDKE
jgi:dTDP-glucose pyrophosphorylase/predicted transcriptional regulator